MIDINSLTIGQVRELLKLLETGTEPEIDAHRWKGKYVLVRSRNEGVNAGYVVDLGRGFIELKNARRLWYHKPAKAHQSWYEGVALYGLSSDSRISVQVDPKLIVEDYSATLCTQEAKDSILAMKSYES